jgi:hypothetical protein
MLINQIEFSKLEKEVSKTRNPAAEHLACEIGKAYVVAITRDGCSACEKQKPKLDRLATSLTQKYGDTVVFTRIHVKYSPESNEESKRSKNVLGHYFYPTNLILLKTRDRGAIEYYKNSSPTMSELEKNIDAAVKIATMIRNEKT